jgi:WD40 repeat protein
MITDIENFILLTEQKVYYFENNGIVFNKSEIDIKNYKDLANITCGLAYYPPVDSDQEQYIKKSEFYLLTGHKDGEVILWKELTIPRSFNKFKEAVISIVLVPEGIAIMIADQKIYIFDHELKEQPTVIEIFSLPFKFYSNRFKSMISGVGKLFILSYGGDLIKYNLKSRHKVIPSYNKKSKGVRFKDIIALPKELYSMSFIEKNGEKLLFISCENNAVIGFSVDSHEIIDIFNTRNQITAIDSITLENKDPMFAYGSITGEIMIREDWQENPTTIEVNGKITDIKFSINGAELMATSDSQEVYCFTLFNNSYFDKPVRRVRFETEVPLSINFTNDRKHALITTNTRKHYRISLQDFKNLNQIEDSLFNISYLELKFSLNPKLRESKSVSCLLGQELKFITAGDEFGNLMIWKSVEQLKENCGVLLGGHSSKIGNLCLSRNQDYLFVQGMNDRTVTEWKIMITSEKQQDPMGANLAPNPASAFTKTGEAISSNQPDFGHKARDHGSSFDNAEKNSDQKSSKIMGSKNVTPIHHLDIEDSIIKREILFCKTNWTDTDQMTDSLSQIRGTIFRNLNGLMSQQLEKFQEDDLVQKRVPEIALELDFVYGFEAFDRRKTLFYVHNHSVKDFDIDGLDGNYKKDKNETIVAGTPFGETKYLTLPQNYLKEMLFSKYSAIPYDIQHKQCEKKYIHFVSRVAVISSSQNNSQTFYEGHSRKISAMAIHPSKMIVATAESEKFPQIHVWSVLDLAPLSIIKTQHDNGIINMSFSFDGFFLISLSVDKTHSIQITNWRSEE